MKVVIHTLNFWPEPVSTGKYTGELGFALAERGHSVGVVTSPPYYPNWKIFDGFQAIRFETQVIDGVEITRCPLWVPVRPTGVKRILHLASFGLSSLPVIIKKAWERPDLIIVIEPTLFCLPGAWLAARLCGAKAWLHIQDFEVDVAFELGILKRKWLQRLVSTIEGFWMRRFDRVSTITPRMVERLKDKGVKPGNSILLPNWVDCTAIFPILDNGPLKEVLGLPSHKCIALYSGNIGEKQGLEMIIDAARQLSHAADLHFVICGHGAALERLKDYAGQMENLTWLPVQPVEKLNQLLNAADIHLLPQRADVADLVMPSKLTGMLASGRPTVATAYPDTQLAKVLDGKGKVVPPGDVRRFAEAISTLVADPDQRYLYGKVARRYAVEHLGMEQIIDRFLREAERLGPNALKFRGHAEWTDRRVP
jgi:colanic acid biosynthesis glycosyl transferase WcaI